MHVAEPTYNPVEIIKDRLYFTCICDCDEKKPKSNRSLCYITFDHDLNYRNFFRDFGPLNISCLYKYCCKITKLLNTFKGKKKVVHFTSDEATLKVNAAFLVGAFAIICLRMSPMQIYHTLTAYEPYKQYVDALQRTSVYTIRLYDCLRAISKALQYNLFNFNDFESVEYDKFDLFENGNINWIIPRKFLAFLGPTNMKMGLSHSPSFYLSYFLANDVRTVIRLNEQLYDPTIFLKSGIEHCDLFFEDGSTPGRDIVLNFLRITETAPAAIAVHCKAGLGRTGTLICCYLIKHYMMTAREAVAWNRICRSGSVTGAQQSFLEEHEAWLWKAGSEYRSRHYGNELRMPLHKYGIYSKQWPLERLKIISDAKRRFKMEDRNSYSNPDKFYMKSFKKLLEGVQNLDGNRFQDTGPFSKY